MLVLRFILLYILCITTAYANIKQVYDLSEIEQDIFASATDTLVIFDVDFVLTTPKDEIFIQSATTEGRKVIDDFYLDLRSRWSKKDVEYVHSIVLSSQAWRAVTPETPLIFTRIKNKGYKILGLTASGAGKFGIIDSLDKWRIEGLNALGINFDKHLLEIGPGGLDGSIENIDEYYARAKYSTAVGVSGGIVFTSQVPKGKVLEAYLPLAKIKPKKIIFIDDRIENLKSVAEYCEKNDIQYLGFEYLAVKSQAAKLSLNRRRALIQYKILEYTKTWVDDIQADAILNAIDSKL